MIVEANSNILATDVKSWMLKEPDLERLKGWRGEVLKGWDGWMASHWLPSGIIWVQLEGLWWTEIWHAPPVLWCRELRTLTEQLNWLTECLRLEFTKSSSRLEDWLMITWAPSLWRLMRLANSWKKLDAGKIEDGREEGRRREDQDGLTCQLIVEDQEGNLMLRVLKVSWVTKIGQ